MNAPNFRCSSGEPAPRREVELLCSQCRWPIVLINPSGIALDEPLCPLCQVMTFDGACWLLGFPTQKDKP